MAFSLLLAVTSASATSILSSFSLSGDFSDGSTLSGSITLNFTRPDDCSDCTWSLSASDWDVTVSGGTISAYTFNPTDSTFTITGDPLFDLLQNDPVELLLQTVDPYLDPFDNFDFNPTGSSYTNNGNTVQMTEGEMDVTSSPVPESPTWALMGAGALLLLGLAWRRHGAAPGQA